MADTKLIDDSLKCEAIMGDIFLRLVRDDRLNKTERLAVAELLYTHLRSQATVEELSQSDAIVQRRKAQWAAAQVAIDRKEKN